LPLSVTSPLTAPHRPQACRLSSGAACVAISRAFADGGCEGFGFLGAGFELGQQPRPVLGGGSELLSVAGCGAGQQQRLRLVGVELQRPLDQLGRLALQVAAIAPAEDLGIIGEQDRVLVDQRAGAAVGFGRLGKTFQDLV
jgi:hypothetical protein